MRYLPGIPTGESRGNRAADNSSLHVGVKPADCTGYRALDISHFPAGNQAILIECSFVREVGGSGEPRVILVSGFKPRPLVLVGCGLH